MMRRGGIWQLKNVDVRILLWEEAAQEGDLFAHEALYTLYRHRNDRVHPAVK
jgi:hypothetical protein